MSSASFMLTTRDGIKICKECTLADGNSLSSLSTSLRTLKDQVNDVLSEIVTKEKSTNTEGTTKKQEGSENEDESSDESEGNCRIKRVQFILILCTLTDDEQEPTAKKLKQCSS